MIGHNKLQLNKAEMQKAIEYYLNTVVLKVSCVVTDVAYDSNRESGMFVISLMPPKEITTGETLDRALANDTAIEKGNK
jgi:hypothetical protein